MEGRDAVTTGGRPFTALRILGCVAVAAGVLGAGILAVNILSGPALAALLASLGLVLAGAGALLLGSGLSPRAPADRRDVPRGEGAELFSKAFRLSPDCMVVSKLSDRTVISANDALCALWGGTPAEVIGKPTRDYNAWVSEEGRLAFMQTLQADGECLDRDVALRLTDGRLRNMLVSSRLITVDGESCVLSVMRDVTEERKAQALVAHQQALLQTIFDNMTEGIAVLDSEHRVIRLNRAFRRLFAVKDGQASWPQLMDSVEVFLPGGEPLPREQWPSFRAQRGEYIHDFEMGVRVKGSPDTVLAEFNTAPISEKGAGAAQFIVSLRDVSARRRAEAAILASEHRLRATLDRMLEGCQIIGRDWRYIYVNTVAAAHGRVQVADLVGKRMAQVYPGIEATPMFARLKACMEGRVSQQMENRFDYPDGTRAVFQIDIQPAPEGIFVLSLDVTERRDAERAVRQLNEDLERRVVERTAQLQSAHDQLESANKELESFSYSASHDLRGPLRVVDGFASIVLEDYAALLPPEGQSHLVTIRDTAQRMGHLIDDLLKFSRLSRMPLNRETVSAQDQVEVVIADLRRARPDSNVEFRVGILPPHEADPALVRQVWSNLLSNAVKYSSKKPNPRVEVGVEDRDGERIYFVRDNGTGFDMKYAHKLFGVFQRLHRYDEFEGTGVGLAIVQRIVQRHGGRIWADAEAERGACFSFTLAAPTVPAQDGPAS